MDPVAQTPYPCCDLPGSSARFHSERRTRAGPGALNPTTRAVISPDPVLAFVPSPRARALPGALNPTPALSLRFDAKPGTTSASHHPAAACPRFLLLLFFPRTVDRTMCQKGVWPGRKRNASGGWYKLSSSTLPARPVPHGNRRNKKFCNSGVTRTLAWEFGAHTLE